MPARDVRERERNSGRDCWLWGCGVDDDGGEEEEAESERCAR